MAWELRHSVIANVARDVAWAWWTTVDNWRRHEGDAVESITLDGPFETGARGETRMPGQSPRSWLLAEVEAPARAVIEMELGDATLRIVWTFDDLGDGRTKLTQQMKLDGPSADHYAADLEAGFAPNIGPGMEKIALGMAEGRAVAE